MKIILLVFGKLTEKFYQAAEMEFRKRLQRFAVLTVIELSEESRFSEEQNRTLNTKKLLQRLITYLDYQVIFFDLHGQLITSLFIAETLAKNQNQGPGKILFIIGPSQGYDQSLIADYQHHWSLGKITLPHQLCRIVVLEQIYRGFKIFNRQIYHK